MGKDVAKSKGNYGRRSGQRNQGLPHGVKRMGAISSLPNADEILSSSPTVFELARRNRLFRRWGVKFGLRSVFGNAVK